MTLDQCTAFGKQHVVELIVGYVVTNLVATSMPPAGPDSSVGYKWLYAFIHGALLNVRNVVSVWVPKAGNIPGFQKAEEQAKLTTSAGS